MHPSTVSTTLPALPPGFVLRENVNMTIDSMLDGDAEVILVQGRDGVGKTTLLNGYARYSKGVVVCIFLRPLRLSYEPTGVIGELWSQLRFALTGRSEEPPAVPRSPADLAALIQRLALKLQGVKRIVTVVVDGLDEVKVKDRAAAREILDLLPLGRPAFRFVLSGDVEDLVQEAGVRSTSLRLTLFSIAESRQLFNGVDVEAADVDKAHAVCNGVVGHLAAVRRLVVSGLSVSDILEKQPKDLEDTMSLEWHRVQQTDADYLRLLAVIAFDHRRHSSCWLASVCKVTTAFVDNVLDMATFLTCGPDDTIDFISDAFRLFAQRKLERYRQPALESIIAELRSGDTPQDVAGTLPMLMVQAQQHEQVVELLDSQYISTVAESAQSASAIGVQAAIGARAADAVTDEVALYKFRLIQGLAASLKRTGHERSEVAALVAVGEAHQALGVARNATFREDRLSLFALALAKMVEFRISVDDPLRDELRQLCAAADVEALGDTIRDLAVDTFAVEPKAALQLLERFGNATGKTHVLDWIMATLSFQHATRRHKAETDEQPFERLHERIVDTQLRTLSESAGVLADANAADEVIEQCSKIDDPVSRLTILRLWLDINKRQPDATRVSVFALDLAVKTSEYAITVPVLRQFAAPLPYASPDVLTQDAIRRIDGLLSIAQQRAPSIEYVRLQLLLARAQKACDMDAAHLRVVELYMFVAKLEDIATKAACLARLYSGVSKIEPTREHNDIRDEMCAVVQQLLMHSADHEETMLPVLLPLVARDAELACALVDQINTDSRRDYVRQRLVEEIAEAGSQGRERLLAEQVDKIDDPLCQASALIQALSVSRRKANGDAVAKALWQAVVGMQSPEDRALSFAFVAGAVKEDKARDAALLQVEKALESIRSSERRSELACDIAYELATVRPDRAAELLRRAMTGAQASVTAPSFMWAVRLGCRALRGLVRTDRDGIDELDRILELCRLGPDILMRTSVLSELSYWMFAEGRSELSDKIYSQDIVQILEEAKAESNALFWRCFRLAGWAVFSKHERAFLDGLEGVPARERERIVRDVARTITCGVPCTDAYEVLPDRERLLTYKDCTDLATLVELVEDDALIFNVVRAVSRSALLRGTRLTREQKKNVQDKFEKLVEHKLPCLKKVRHDGYKWACAAELLNFNDNARESNWREILGYAKTIPNIPDAALTITLVAASAPGRYRDLRMEAVRDARELARQIKVASERADCLERLAAEIWSWDSKSAQELLRESSEASIAIDDTSDDDKRAERLLDLAYRISPDFAQALSSEMDTDPVRGLARQRRLRARRKIDARNEMLDEGRDRAGELLRRSLPIVVQAAWRNLGSLNANAIEPRLPKQLRRSLEAGAQWAIESSFPLFAWVVQNWVERVAEKRQKAVTLRSLTQANIVVAELIRSVGRTRRKMGTSVTEEGDDREMTEVIVLRGEREKVVEVIASWCSRVRLAYVKIADQYFGPNDIGLLRHILQHNPACHVQILTSRRHIQQEVDGDVAQAFSDAWSKHSLEQMPPTDITVVGVPPSSKSPIHDRWWIADGSALDFGTSANAIGYDQDSSVRELGAEQAAQMQKTVDKYLDRTVRHTEAGRITYTTYTL